MKVLCAGGGSGGHVTPVVVVINEIAAIDSAVEVMFVCDKAFETQARGLMEQNAAVPVTMRVISAGKFRRYKHLTFWQHFMVRGLVWANVRDIVKTMGGVFQSIALFTTFRPDVVFAKGGYVCLPVGIAAKLFRIPLVIHDSDARPGVTNSIIGRWATRIGTGSPLENYNYSSKISKYVGVPIAPEFRPYSKDDQDAAKQALGFTAESPLIVVTGGGLGAVTINKAIVRIAALLLDDGVSIMHVTGKKHFDDVSKHAIKHERYKIVPFVYEDMARVLGAADIVVTRSSATFTQELAGLGKPVVLIPSKALGDQIKNAEVYKSAKAAVVLSDDEISDTDTLLTTIRTILADEALASELSHNLHAFARPDAAAEVARLVIESATS